MQICKWISWPLSIHQWNAIKKSGHLNSIIAIKINFIWVELIKIQRLKNSMLFVCACTQRAQQIMILEREKYQEKNGQFIFMFVLFGIADINQTFLLVTQFRFFDSPAIYSIAFFSLSFFYFRLELANFSAQVCLKSKENRIVSNAKILCPEQCTYFYVCVISFVVSFFFLYIILWTESQNKKGGKTTRFVYILKNGLSSSKREFWKKVLLSKAISYE